MEYKIGQFVPTPTPQDEKRGERRERVNALTLALSVKNPGDTPEQIVAAAKVFATYLAAE